MRLMIGHALGIVVLALVLLLGGCAGFQRALIGEAGRQVQIVTFTPEQTEQIRQLAAGQVDCGPGKTAIISGVKDAGDKITVAIRCE